MDSFTLGTREGVVNIYFVLHASSILWISSEIEQRHYVRDQHNKFLSDKYVDFTRIWKGGLKEMIWGDLKDMIRGD